MLVHVWWNHGVCYIRKPKHRSQWPVASKAWNALLICSIYEFFLQWSGGYLMWKCTIFTRKNFHAALKVWRFVKIMHHYVFFSVPRAKLGYAILHPLIILEAQFIRGFIIHFITLWCPKLAYCVTKEKTELIQ